MGPWKHLCVFGIKGENTIENSLKGYLKGDGIGVRFYTDIAAELAFDINATKDVTSLSAALDAVHFKIHDEKGDKQAAFMLFDESTRAAKCKAFLTNKKRLPLQSRFAGGEVVF